MSTGLLVPASAALVAVALAAGLEPGHWWLVALLILVAMAQGTLAGTALRRFWRGTAQEEIFGAGGRYVGFLAAVLFSAVEAYAVGDAIAGKGAPKAAVALLLPPVLLAAAALRSAVKARREAERGGPAGATAGPSDDSATSEE